MRNSDESLREGWYLMTVDELERELARWRNPESNLAPSDALRLTVAEAIAYRNAGNLPDEQGRTLRLVLELNEGVDLTELESKRRRYEPDFQQAPDWKRPGSRSVNVVPLRSPGVRGQVRERWWDDPELAALETEWTETGVIDGIAIPGEFRGFLYKTILSLRAAGQEISVDSIVDSLKRWLEPHDLEQVSRALKQANATRSSPADE